MAPVTANKVSRRRTRSNRFYRWYPCFLHQSVLEPVLLMGGRM
jgi:hypothetical protein